MVATGGGAEVATGGGAEVATGGGAEDATGGGGAATEAGGAGAAAEAGGGGAAAEAGGGAAAEAGGGAATEAGGAAGPWGAGEAAGAGSRVDMGFAARRGRREVEKWAIKGKGESWERQGPQGAKGCQRISTPREGGRLAAPYADVPRLGVKGGRGPRLRPKHKDEIHAIWTLRYCNA